MSEQPPALDPATLRWAADMVPRAPGDSLSVATWLRALAAQAEQQAATPPDVRDAVERDQEGAIRGDCCEHGVIWHHERRGCGYHGYGDSRCTCALTHDEALAGVLASTPRPEGETRAATQIAEAERLLALAESTDWTSEHEPYRAPAIAAAQAYATLAVAEATLAAARAAVSPVERDGDDR